ncbi:hypothetical protein HQ32_04580 [Prauserella sp. Am3]|nr:hypothetical protein HQ32_04580 [Prauserella sp. Am3]
MSSSAESTAAVSDPANAEYDPHSPFYDVTADPSSIFYVGPIEDTARSGDEIRAEVTSLVEADPIGSALSDKDRDAEIQGRYSAAIEEARRGLDEGLELRTVGERPVTIWDNASHEQMVEVLNNNADSVAIADTSEEWVRLGNDLTVHQRSVADAIDDSMANWSGDAGDAARRHLADVAKWLGVTAQGAVLTGRQQQIHSQTLNESQKQMAANPPVPFSAQEANAALQQITDPVQYAQAASQANQKVQEQQAAREQAARIMNQFDDTVGSATSMPLFAPPPKLAGDASSATSATPLGTSGGRTATTVDQLRVDGAAASGDAAAAQAAAGTPAAGLGNGVQGNADSVGADPAAAARQVQVPDFAGAGAGTAQAGSAGASAAHGAADGVPGTPGPGLPAPGGAGPGGRTAGGEVPNVQVPGVDVPDLPDAGPGVGAPGGVGDVPNGPAATPATTTSSYVPPDLSSTPSAKTPTIGWNGGINGDSISNRLNGPDGLPGVGPAGQGGRQGKAGSTPGLGAAGLPGGAAGAAGSVGGGPGTASGGAAGSAGSAAGSAGGAAAPGQSSGAAKNLPSTGPTTNNGTPAGPGGPRSGAPGMAGMPAAGAGRQKEEDKERKSPGYLEPEENLFAGEQAIAPPVIGDWKNNKDNNWK